MHGRLKLLSSQTQLYEDITWIMFALPFSLFDRFRAVCSLFIESPRKKGGKTLTM